jgi:hypothetical protein
MPMVSALTWIDPQTAKVQPVTGWLAFALLALWSTQSMQEAQLPAALGLYLVFTLFHCAAPLLLQHLRRNSKPSRLIQTFPIIALMTTLVPVFRATEVSYFIWPFILLVNMAALWAAVCAATLLPALLALVLTLVVAGALLVKVPLLLTGLPALLSMVGLFSVFFASGSLWVIRQLSPVNPGSANRNDEDSLPGALSSPDALTAILPGSSAVLPFLLLIVACYRLPIFNPSPVFCIAFLLVLVLLSLSKALRVESLPLVGLCSTLALECIWHFRLFSTEHAPIAVAWYLAFYMAFFGFPFLFRKTFGATVLPWVSAALSGPLHFFLVFGLIKEAYPNPLMGLVLGRSGRADSFLFRKRLLRQSALRVALDHGVDLLEGCSLGLRRQSHPSRFSTTDSPQVDGLPGCVLSSSNRTFLKRPLNFQDARHSDGKGYAEIFSGPGSSRIAVLMEGFVSECSISGSRRFGQVHQTELLRRHLSRKHPPLIHGQLPRYSHNGFLLRRRVGRGPVHHGSPFLGCRVLRLLPDHSPLHLYKHRPHSRIPALGYASSSAFPPLLCSLGHKPV